MSIRSKIHSLGDVPTNDANLIYYNRKIKDILEGLAREVEDLEDRIETLELNQD